MKPKVWRAQPRPADSVSVSLTARDVNVSPAPGLSSEAIAEIRGRLGLSQAVFAQALNVSPDTVRGWEQGKRVPDGASLRLLELAEQHPEWVLDAVTPVHTRQRGYRR